MNCELCIDLIHRPFDSFIHSFTHFPWPLAVLNLTRRLLVHDDFDGDSALAALGVLPQDDERREEAIRVHRDAPFLCIHDPIDRFLCDRSVLFPLKPVSNNHIHSFI